MIDGLISLIREMRSLAERREKVQEANFIRFVETLYEKFQPGAHKHIQLFEEFGRRASEATSTIQLEDCYRNFVPELIRWQVNRLPEVNTARSKASTHL